MSHSRIEAPRCAELHQLLSDFGAVGKHSVTRLAYTREESTAHRVLASQFGPRWQRETDAFGNTFLTLPGTEPLSAIGIGSHLDTVPDGGVFDGVSGCVAGLQVAEALDAENRRLRHPIRVIFWRGEESSRFRVAMLGSKLFCGQLGNGQLDSLTDATGVTLAQAMAAEGLTPTIRSKSAAATELSAYLELHIEQAAMLATKLIPVGVVGDFCGTWRAVVTVNGRCDHSASLRCERQNAGLAAATMVVEVARLLSGIPEDRYPVVTSGFFHQNGAMNVVAGGAKFSIDFRGLDNQELLALGQQCLELIPQIAERHRVTVGIQQLGLTDSVATSRSISQVLHDACQALGIPAIDIISRAGHDGVPLIGAGVPVGMILVRSGSRVSNGGYSHCPDEVASAEDLVAGTRTLLETVTRLDQSLD